jgi:stage II sporulation protein D
VDRDTVVAALEKTVESNQMSWIRGPFTPDQLLSSLKGKTKTPLSGPVRTLEISGTGPSGRATEILANSSRVDVKYPDLFRSALGGLPSTRFKIDETARMTVAGAGGSVSQRPTDGGTLTALRSGGQAEELDGPLYILNGDGIVRAATTAPSFRFIGSGEGHGVGLSQYGALGLANSGYDYKYILQYYYKDVTIAKE